MFSLCWLSYSSPVDTRDHVGKNTRICDSCKWKKSPICWNICWDYRKFSQMQCNLFSLPEDLFIKISELCGWWQWLYVPWFSPLRQGLLNRRLQLDLLCSCYDLELTIPQPQIHKCHDCRLMPSCQVSIALWSHPCLTHVNNGTIFPTPWKHRI